MSVTLTRRRIRCKVDAAKFPNLVDFKTGNTIRVPRGNDAQLDFLIMYGSELVSLANFATLRLEIMDSARSGSDIADVTVAQVDFELAATLADFEAGTDQHLIVPLTAAMMNQAPDSGSKEKTFWAVLSGLTTDVPAYTVTIAGGAFIIEEDGTGVAVVAPEPVDQYYTREEADGRYIQRAEHQARWRFHQGELYLYNPDTGKHHPIVPRGAEGAVGTAWGAGVDL